MNRKNWNASITVFLSLVCILFLALICAAMESARIEGARAQSAAITGMGTFSLLSEFEPKLLNTYGLFALDAGISGSFQMENFKARNCIVAVEADAAYVCSPVFFVCRRSLWGSRGRI